MIKPATPPPPHEPPLAPYGLPASAQQAQAVAGQHGMVIPPECMEGVVANLALLARHAAIFAGGAA